MRKIIAILLALVAVFSLCSISAAAFSYDGSYGNYDAPENSGDYAQWNGSKMVKSSSTDKREVQWMQAALNYCKKNLGVSFSDYLEIDGKFGPASKKATQAFQSKYKLTVDGSFGPSTIKKMKDVLPPTPTPAPTPSPSSKITTKQIQSVLDTYGYVTNKYWNHKSGASATSGYMATNQKGRSYSYSYNGVECYGFANFVMHKVTGVKSVNPNNGNKDGWKYIKASDVKELKVGDIVRIGKSNSNGHSGVVLTVDGAGNCTFAQCFGGVDNKISIGTKLASSSFGSHGTLSSMKNNGVLLYVYRYVG